MHAHVGFSTLTPGALDASLTRARNELLPWMRAQPGLRCFTVVVSGPDSFIALSGWDTRAQAEQAVERFSGWSRTSLGQSVTSVENHLGEVTMLHGETAPDRTPHFGVVRVATPKPDAPDLTEQIRTELLPLFDRQPGFNERATIRTDDGRQVSFIGWDSEELYEQEHPIREWAQRNIAPHMSNTEVYKGAIAWTVRNE